MKKAQRAFAAYPEAIEQAKRRALTMGTILAEKYVKIEATGKSIKVRSGHYRSKITREIHQRLGFGLVANNAIYARLIEEGGTIRPKSKKFLAIPIKGTPAETQGARVGKIANTFSNLVFALSIRGQPILMGSVGEDGEVRPLFLLKRSVKIRPHKIFSTAFAEAEPEIAEIFNKQIALALRGGNK